ncbi:MAG: DUF952 domain-containing protein [Acidimicrobiia bacterium]|nr:DUF952 domain-containing protein [Acidimicrobiia bacterium]
MLLHIITAEGLADARASGQVAPESLESEGFVHCSYPEQVLVPANERFGGQRNLVLLVLNPNQIQAPVVVEDSDGSGITFPHVYGPIPIAAVERVIDFPPELDGRFVLPPAIRDSTSFRSDPL